MEVSCSGLGLGVYEGANFASSELILATEFPVSLFLVDHLVFDSAGGAWRRGYLGRFCFQVFVLPHKIDT